MLLVAQPDLKFAAKDVEKLFAFVGVGFAAAAAGLDAKEMGFHGSVSPGEEFHADTRLGFQDFALLGANQTGIFTGGFEKGKNVGAVKAGDAAKSGDGGAHLAALEGAEEANGNAGGASDLGQRKAAARAQAPEAGAGGKSAFGGDGNDALAFENVDDGGRIEAAIAAKKNGALEEAHVILGVKTVTALRAARFDEAEGLPGAESGGRNAHAAGDFADLKEGTGGASSRNRG